MARYVYIHRELQAGHRRRVDGGEGHGGGGEGLFMKLCFLFTQIKANKYQQCLSVMKGLSQNIMV